MAAASRTVGGVREGGTVFDLDAFVVDCKAAAAETEPRTAIVEVLRRTMADASAVADALDPQEGGLTIVHADEDVTVLHVVWAPDMVVPPHDHLMWAAIGVYTGAEDNTFYRRVPEDRRHLEQTAGKRLVVGDAVVMGADAIHGVHNPHHQLTGALHVYGGDFVSKARSAWESPSPDGPLEERPYDTVGTQQIFAEANARWKAETGRA
jgi:predicted metal-dependent enzyme (double-stranded beta helix superfamily)